MTFFRFIAFISCHLNRVPILDFCLIQAEDGVYKGVETFISYLLYQKKIGVLVCVIFQE